MTDEDDEKIGSWFKDWEIDHGAPKDIADLYEIALCLCDDIPIGYEASHRLATWIFGIYNSTKASYEEKNGNENADDICDSVNHPAHYTSGGIECIDAIESSMSHAEFEGYLKGNVFKYLWRYRNKNAPVEDLKKAQWYHNKLIEYVMKEISNGA